MLRSYDELENSFRQCLEDNRRGNVRERCPSEAFFAPAFFHPNVKPKISSERDIGIRLPFPAMWIITNYRGIVVCAYVERWSDTIIVPDYQYFTYMDDHLWFPIPWEKDKVLTCAVDEALRVLVSSDRQEVDSPIRDGINRGRLKTIGKTSFLPELPKFIRIRPPRANPSSGVGDATRQGHERRGHWRSYRSGKRIWIDEMKIKGGSPVARNYRL